MRHPAPFTQSMLALLALSALALNAGPSISAPPAPSAIAATSGIIENRGQLDAPVRYYAPGSPVNTYFTSQGLMLDIVGERGAPVVAPDPHAVTSRHAVASPGRTESMHRSGSALLFRFEDANPAPVMEPRSPSAARHHYFRGSDPRGWQTDVPAFQEIIYREVWPGIDVGFKMDPGGITYELVVTNPLRADLSRARFAYEGAERVTRAEDGSLVIETSAGLLRDAPSTVAGHQGRITRITETGGRNSADGVITTNRHEQDNRAGGSPSAPADTQDDPAALLWSTFLGGGSDDLAWDLELDSAGNIVVAGLTISLFFPTTPGAYDETYNQGGDVFISKFDPSGSTLLWSTFLGGTFPNFDYGYGVALDPDDNPVVTGYTFSEDFPTTPGAFDQTHNGGNDTDVFVSKLDATGSTLIWSTFIGGESIDIGYSLTLDSERNAVVAGRTLSAGFPIRGSAYDPSQNGEEDGFVLKLAADGSDLLWSTFIGGIAYDGIQEVTLGAGDNVIACGFSSSADFPTTPDAFDEDYNGGLYDGFVFRMAADGSGLVFSTFLGSSGDFDFVNSLTLDEVANAIVTGVTSGSDFPVTTGAYDESYNGNDDVFVAKLDASGGNLHWSTFLGGSEFGYETAFGVGLDEGDNVVVAGATPSPDFPTTSNGYDTSFNGFVDVWVAKLNSTGSDLLWGTFLGGTDFEAAFALRLDSAGDPIFAGYTSSPNFPTTTGAYDTGYNGGDADVFVSKLHISDTPTAVLLSSFHARLADEAILLEWTTAMEFEFLGFHVYRRQEGGSWHRLTDTPLATGPDYRYEDREVEAGQRYEYEIEALDLSGDTSRFGPISIVALSSDRATVRFEPNPMHARAQVRFSVPEAGRVRLDVFDLAGRQVRNLVEGTIPAGIHEADWDGRDHAGQALPAGVYYLRVQTPAGTETRPITIVR